MNELPLNTVQCGDCREVMATFPADSIDLVVTSPPYWGLRDYGHKDQLGLESHPQLYIDHLVEICREIKRVIKPRGSFWLNLGDTYCHKGGNASGGNENSSLGEKHIAAQRRARYNGELSNWLQPKQLLGIPWRVATALQDDGWILRNCVIWFKPNHMPESVRDRLTKSYEFFFFFVKQRKYYFDLDAIREPVQTENRDYLQQDYNGKYKETIDHETLGSPRARYNRNKTPGMNIAEYRTSRRELGLPEGNINGKNPGDVWEVNTHPFPGSHFAVFPPDLIEPIIKSSSPPNGTILDPFAGSGTALRVARKLGRKFIGIELNPEYAAMCERRVRADTYTSPPEGVPTLWEALEK